MALTATTLASAVGVSDTSIVVALATGFAAGSWVKVDQELMQVMKSYASGVTIPVSRGVDGTATAAHKASALVVVELSTDLPAIVPQSITHFPVIRSRQVTSYSAAGAITLPIAGSDAVAIINGTGALAMTLAAPTKDQDGDILTIVSNGKAAHTITYTAGFGANTTNSDVVTLHATQTVGFSAIACNGVWVLISVVAGAATVAGGGLG